jgi:hypothetical protein
VEEEVVYENAVSHFWSITEQRIFAFFHLIPGVRIRIHNLRFSWGIRILDSDSKHAPAAFGKKLKIKNLQIRIQVAQMNIYGSAFAALQANKP